MTWTLVIWMMGNGQYSFPALTQLPGFMSAQACDTAGQHWRAHEVGVRHGYVCLMVPKLEPRR